MGVDEAEKTNEAQVGKKIQVKLKYQPFIFLGHPWFIPVVELSTGERFGIWMHGVWMHGGIRLWFTSRKDQRK